jgi:hypothetical protein
MKRCKAVLFGGVALLVPCSAWAGTMVAKAVVPAPAPALGEVGLIALGVGLVGAGLAFLRKR